MHPAIQAAIKIAQKHSHEISSGVPKGHQTIAPHQIPNALKSAMQKQQMRSAEIAKKLVKRKQTIANQETP